MRRIDELHLEAPFFGARKIAAQLRREGQLVGRRHVRTLMRKMGIQTQTLHRRPRTSIPAREAAIYPYLLENVVIERAAKVCRRWDALAGVNYLCRSRQLFLPVLGFHQWSTVGQSDARLAITHIFPLKISALR